MELVGAEFLYAIRRAFRKPTGVDGTCANRYGGCTGTWENLLSPAGTMGGHPIQRKSWSSDEDCNRAKRNAIDSRYCQAKETK